MGKKARKPPTAPTEESVASGALELPEPRAEPEERDLTRRAKIGELMMRLKLAEHVIEKRGLAEEGAQSKRDRAGAPGSTIVAGAIP